MTKITIGGTEYIFRFDMSVMTWMEERFGSFEKAVQELQKSGSRAATLELAAHFTEAAAVFLGIPEPDVSGLLTDHSSLSRYKKINTAMREALADSARMEAADEDDTAIRDPYLAEIEAAERKNAAAGC